MKKIVLYTSGQLAHTRLTGGVKRFLELLKELPKYCELTLVAGDQNYEVAENAKFVSLCHGNKVYRNEISRAIHNFTHVLKLKRDKHDHIIVFDVPPALLLSLLNVPHICLMVRKDLVGYTKQSFEERHMNKYLSILMLKMICCVEAIVVSQTEKIIVQCDYDKEQLISRHPHIADKIRNKVHVQINNINASWVKAEKCEKHFEHDAFSVGCITSFSSLRKGCDIFLEASKLLIDRGYKIKAYIAGDGKLLNQYKEKYTQYDGIVFLGKIKSPDEIYSKCQLAVVPSREDSCPNTLLEALVTQTPVIGANRGGIPEILRDNNALFEPTLEALAEKMIGIINDKEKIECLAHKQVIRKDELTFDWAKRIFDQITHSN